MCGIAGIISPNTSLVTVERVKKMTDAIAHRGPDGEGHWVNLAGNISLGHRRLSIIDLSDAGAQPMHFPSPEGEGSGVRYTIIHNGEIYNYTELKDELQKKGYSFLSKTDTEVIAAAYDCWEDNCVEHFDGMFAFAIWDEKTKTLFAARDRFGEKPFYYYFDEQQFIFASEMKALWAAGIDRTPNRKMLFNFITIGYTDNPLDPEETFFEKIHKLPAASSLFYYADTHELDTEKYWDINIEDVDHKITDEDASQQFLQLFQTSVQRRLRSDVEVGTSLSGGLDSSSVVATAYPFTIHHSPFAAFTATFPGFEKDESTFAKQTAEKFDLRHFTIPVTETDLINDFEKISFHQEEPFNSASVLAQYKVYDLAKQQGIKVLLDGQGADEILAGYHKYYKYYWQELFMKRKLMLSGEIKAARKIGINESFGAKNIIAALFPDFASVFLEKHYLLHALQQEDLSAEFIKMQSKEAYYTTPAYKNLNGILYFNTIEHGLEELLRYADRNSMAHGRETRLPFLNHQLVEFLFTLPSKFKIRNGWTKWLLRNGMEKTLPPEITWRRDKTGFEPPQKQWMQSHPVRQMIQEAKTKLVKEKILKPEVLNKNIQPLGANDADNFDWRYLSASILFK
jgi:asparagine synthase (glutamine-hydrolysing)